jgi:hypothetical protein
VVVFDTERGHESSAGTNEQNSNERGHCRRRGPLPVERLLIS